MIVAVAFVVGLFVQRYLSPVHDGSGAAVPIIAPGMWGFWIPYFGAVLALAVALGVLTLRVRIRNQVTAAFSTVLTAAGVVPLLVLFWRARVINPALGHGSGPLVTPGSWIAWLATIVIGFVAIAPLVVMWRAHNRATGAGSAT